MKKLTLLFVLLFTSVGFSQTSLGETGVDPNVQIFGNGITQNFMMAPCSYLQPNAGTPSGYSYLIGDGRAVADDFDVLPNETFTPDTFIAPTLLFNPNTLVSADIVFYDDAGGVPGTAMFTLVGQVPVAQPVIGSAFGRDILEVTFDLSGSGVSLDGGPGGATYWVALTNGVDSSAGDNPFWDVTDTVTGNECAFNPLGAGWVPGTVEFGSPRDVVMLLSGDCSPTGGGSTVVSINPLKDNTIYQEVPGNSNGAGQLMFAGANGVGAFDRALITFDIAGNVPPGVTITDVTLTMTSDHPTANNGPQDTNLHRLLEDWGEGLSNTGTLPGQGGGGFGAPAIAPDATWNDAFLGLPWAGGSGGTFNPASSAVQTVDTNGPYVWSSPTLISDVQDMLDNPGSNFGWIVVGVETGGTAKRFGTRESPIPPVLEITYTTVSGPALYGADAVGNYFSIDITTGAATLISASFNNPPIAPCGTGSGVTEIVYDASSGTAWGQARDGCGYGFTFNPLSGALTSGPIPTNNNSVGDMQGMEIVGSTLYAAQVTSNSLGTFDPGTGLFTPIGPLVNAATLRGMAYHDGSGTMYGVSGGNPGGSDFGTVDLTTGLFTPISSYGLPLGSIDFGPDGMLYGGESGGGSPGDIYRIDTATGALTFIGNTGLGTPVSGLMLYTIGLPPVISCLPDINVDNDLGLCSAIVNFTDAVALDPEDGAIPTTQITGLPSGSAFPVGDTLIEFSATDSDGNMVTCGFTITVNDAEDPVAVCQDITVEVDPVTGMVTVLPTDIDDGSTDNCAIANIAFAGSPGTPETLTTSFVTNNGSAGNMFDVMPLNDITVNSFDVNNSSGTTVDYEIYFKAGTYVGSETNAGDWTLVGSALGITGAGQDNPTALGLSLGLDLTAGNIYAFYVADIGPGTHRYINGGTAGDLWASDANLEIYEGAGKGGLFGSTFSPRNFSGSIIYESGAVPPFDGTFDCSEIGANVVTIEVTDIYGNTSQCSATVTVEDNTAPVIACVGEPATMTGTTMDSPALPIPDGDPAGISTIMTVTDEFDITDLDVHLDISHTWVGDLIATIESPAGTSVTIVDRMGVPASTFGCSEDDLQITLDDEAVDPIEDECSGSPINGSFIPNNALSAFDGESTLGDWILTVSDNATPDPGVINSWGITYSYDVSGSPYVVELDANGMATENVADLLMGVDEACGWTATVGGGGGAPGSITTLFATGNNGSPGGAVYFDVTVGAEDLTLTDLDTNTDDVGALTMDVYTLVGSYVGNEGDMSAWTLQTSGSGTGAGVDNPSNIVLDSSITLTAGESYGMALVFTSASSHFYTNGDGTNENYDNGDLALALGAASNVPFDGSPFSPRVWNGTLHYTVGSAPATTIDFTCDDLGLNQIEITVTDDSGNTATCTATVEVLDVTPPVIVCADVTIELDEDGVVEIVPQDLIETMPGTYEVISISSDNGSVAEGWTDFTVNVTDADTVSFDWDYTTDDGPAWDSFGYLLNGVYTELTDPAGANQQSGNSGPINVAPGDVFGFRSLSADGQFGASTTTISNFVPGFTGQFDPANWMLELTNSDGDAYFVEIPGGPLAFDACGITIWAVDVTEVTCDDIGTPIVITVFVSDASGNIAACQSTVTVVDLLGPEVVCPEDQTQDPGPGNLYWEVPDYWANGEASATDNCTDPVVVTSQDPAPGTLLPDGVYTVTICAEDEYSNETCCTFELTIESVLGMDDNELSNAIAMYPNPARETVTIANSSNILLDTAMFYDVSGKLVSQIDLHEMQDEKVIDVSALASGVYMVQITGEQSTVVKRLIKE